MSFTTYQRNLPPGTALRDIDGPTPEFTTCATCGERKHARLEFDDPDDSECSDCLALDRAFWKLMRSQRQPLHDSMPCQFPASPAGTETAPAGSGH